MVQLKKKVTIKTKTAQEETPVAAPKPEVKIKKKAPVVEEPKVAPEAPKTPTTPPTPPTPPKSGSKSWMWIVALILIAVIAFFGYKSCSGSETEASGSDKDTTSLVSDSTQTEKSDTTGIEKPETTEGTDEKPQDNAGETDAPATDNVTPKANNGGTEAGKTEQKPTEPVKPALTPKNVDKPVAPAGLVSGSVEENARRVIRGDFGNGKVRKDKLGASYSEIQSRVNEMYRQGLVK